MTKISDRKLGEWLYLELLNHPMFDEMLETTKSGRIKCSKCGE